MVSDPREPQTDIPERVHVVTAFLVTASFVTAFLVTALYVTVFYVTCFLVTASFVTALLVTAASQVRHGTCDAVERLREHAARTGEVEAQKTRRAEQCAIV